MYITPISLCENQITLLKIEQNCGKYLGRSNESKKNYPNSSNMHNYAFVISVLLSIKPCIGY